MLSSFPSHVCLLKPVHFHFRPRHTCHVCCRQGKCTNTRPLLPDHHHAHVGLQGMGGKGNGQKWVTVTAPASQERGRAWMEGWEEMVVCVCVHAKGTHYMSACLPGHKETHKGNKGGNNKMPGMQQCHQSQMHGGGKAQNQPKPNFQSNEIINY